MTAEHDAETRVDEQTDDLGEIAAGSEAADPADTSVHSDETQPNTEGPVDEAIEGDLDADGHAESDGQDHGAGKACGRLQEPSCAVVHAVRITKRH